MITRILHFLLAGILSFPASLSAYAIIEHEAVEEEKLTNESTSDEEEIAMLVHFSTEPLQKEKDDSTAHVLLALGILTDATAAAMLYVDKHSRRPPIDYSANKGAKIMAILGAILIVSGGALFLPHQFWSDHPVNKENNIKLIY